jgi:hypothetical protein
MKLFPIYSQKVEYLKILHSDIFPYQFTKLTHYNITWNTLQPKNGLQITPVLTQFIYPLSAGFKTPTLYGAKFSEGTSWYRFYKSAAASQYYLSYVLQ